jgi:NAD(P)-dependent dehydrogenase (short-subunit alcohol dehydrogenase family)
MSSLENKVIIVTGGSGLLGKEIIQRINQDGGIAINFDLNINTDIEHHKVCCNVTERESVIKAVSLVEKYFNRIDGLVNNAYPRTKDWGERFENIPKESFDKNLVEHLNGYILVCQTVMSVMKKLKTGSIVNMGSIYGVQGPDFTIYEGTQMTSPAAYSAIKGGIINFSRYLASYLGEYGIRVNSISPGGIFNNQNKTFVRNYEKKVPLKRMGKPSDIAPPVCFLLSEDARYITGHNLIVDGGWTSI